MRIVDLTGTIEQGMWDYGDPIPAAQIWQVATIQSTGWEAHAFTLSTITGTYIESAAHMIPGSPTIDQIAPERFITLAAVLQVPDKKALEHITVRELRTAAPAALRPGMGILVSCGWDRHWNRPDFVRGSPHFEEEAMDWIVSQQPSLLGIDVPCSEDPDPKRFVDLNTRLFRSGALLLSPLVNLRELDRPVVKLTALPLKIKGICGTPCRALAELGP
jgi:arylformamidase